MAWPTAMVIFMNDARSARGIPAAAALAADTMERRVATIPTNAKTIERNSTQIAISFLLNAAIPANSAAPTRGIKVGRKP